MKGFRSYDCLLSKNHVSKINIYFSQMNYCTRSERERKKIGALKIDAALFICVGSRWGFQSPGEKFLMNVHPGK